MNFSLIDFKIVQNGFIARSAKNRKNTKKKKTRNSYNSRVLPLFGVGKIPSTRSFRGIETAAKPSRDFGVSSTKSIIIIKIIIDFAFFFFFFVDAYHKPFRENAQAASRTVITGGQWWRRTAHDVQDWKIASITRKTGRPPDELSLLTFSTTRTRQ